jgi:hypothetical protein
MDTPWMVATPIKDSQEVLFSRPPIGHIHVNNILVDHLFVDLFVSLLMDYLLARYLLVDHLSANHLLWWYHLGMPQQPNSRNFQHVYPSINPKKYYWIQKFNL